MTLTPATRALDHTPAVRHTDPATTGALTTYLRALGEGRSIVVRPRAAFEGLKRVTATLTALAPDPLLVTDLHENADLHSVTDPPSDSAAVLPDPEPEAVFAYHTSGSTGSPKCVVYRREQVLSHAQAVSDVLELGREFVWAALPPMRFAYGLSIVNSHHFAGLPVTFTDADWGLPGLETLLADDDRPLALYALPQHTPLLLASTIPGDRLGRLLIAGGRLSGTSATALARRFPRLQLTNMYGQAEMGPRLATWHGPAGDFTEGLIGRPIPGVTLSLCEDAPGTKASTNDEAAAAVRSDSRPILARSEHAMTYCLRAPYEALEPFAGRTELVPTGDLGHRIDAGPHTTLWHHAGRADHVVNVAGTKVDARRVAAIVQESVAPLLIGVSTRPGRLGGDVVPVVELVPDGPAPRSTAPIRRALHAEFGSLAALFDIRYVDRLTAKESGK